VLDAVWVAWAVVVAAALVDWWSVLRDRRAVERWAKPAVMLGLIGVVLGSALPDSGGVGPGGDPTAVWLLLALALCLVGDVMLLGDGPSRFVAGLAAFLLGHLAYVAAFVASGLAAPALAVVGLVVLVASLVLGRGILPGARAEGGPRLAGAVASYMAVIGAMVVTGWATGRLVVGLGASAFVVSDTVLALGRFVAEHRWTRIVVMVTYHLAQVLLVVGLVG